MLFLGLSLHYEFLLFDLAEDGEGEGLRARWLLGEHSSLSSVKETRMFALLSAGLSNLCLVRVLKEGGRGCAMCSVAMA